MLIEELNVRIRQTCYLLFNPLIINIMARAPSLTSILRVLPLPPPPTKMQVDDYVKLLNVLHAKPDKRKEVLDALKKYNKDSADAALKLKTTLTKISKTK
jgi:hypothetical protein